MSTYEYINNWSIINNRLSLIGFKIGYKIFLPSPSVGKFFLDPEWNQSKSQFFFPSFFDYKISFKSLSTLRTL